MLILLTFGIFTVQHVNGAKKTLAKTVAVSYSVRRDRRAVSVYMSGLAYARAVSYMLSYTRNGIPDGVAGTLNLKRYKKNWSNTLVFGTASNKVYTYHRNIKNVVLEVNITLKNGKSQTKRFKIKI